MIMQQITRGYWRKKCPKDHRLHPSVHFLCAGQQGPADFFRISQQLDLCLLRSQLYTVGSPNGDSNIVGRTAIIQLPSLDQDLHLLPIDIGWDDGT